MTRVGRGKERERVQWRGEFNGQQEPPAGSMSSARGNGCERTMNEREREKGYRDWISIEIRIHVTVAVGRD